jgi:hypothetical protein
VFLIRSPNVDLYPKEIKKKTDNWPGKLSEAMKLVLKCVFIFFGVFFLTFTKTKLDSDLLSLEKLIRVRICLEAWIWDRI